MSGWARGESEEGKVKIGVLDIIRAFDAYKKSDDLENELMEEVKSFSVRIEEEKKELENLDGEIAMLSLESERRVELVSKRAALAQKYQAVGQEMQRVWLAKQSNMLVGLYDDMVSAVKEYAEAEGYTLVLKSDAKDVRGGTPDEVQLRIAVRPVLYYSSMHDITDDIIGVLNTKYEEEKKAAAEQAIPTDLPEESDESQESGVATDVEEDS